MNLKWQAKLSLLLPLAVPPPLKGFFSCSVGLAAAVCGILMDGSEATGEVGNT